LRHQVLAAAPKSLAVYGIVYNPLETQFLRDARALSCAPMKQCAGLDISASLMREEGLRAASQHE
jgi:shikimate 5-dehydrogenase